MSRNRFTISIMVISIAVISSFQVFWLVRNYQEQKSLFLVHAHMLFRETLFKLQASKLHLDTNIRIRVQQKEDMVTMTNVIQQQIRDTVSRHPLRNNSSVVLAYQHAKVPGTGDSNRRYFVNTKEATLNLPALQEDSSATGAAKGSRNRVFDFLVGVDSLQDSISITDIRQHFASALAREGIHIPFQISKSTGDSSISWEPPDPMDNRVTLGFTRPVTYALGFDRASLFVLRRLLPQILFSVLLIGLAVFSSLLLYRNWQQQKRISGLKNDFISNITHELKTPIATVSVAIEALKNFNALDDPEKTREYLSISTNELQRLSLLVDKVLKLTMFENEQVEWNSEIFDLKALVEEVLASMRLQFEKYRAISFFEASGNGFRVKADKLHLTSVVYNLVDNALKYSKTDPAVKIALTRENDQLLLSVTDNGIGIPPAYQQQIFDKFFRVPSGNQHNVKGYGLGLSYVAYVLQKMGGSIRVESREAAGSCFTMKIPGGNEQD